MIKVRAHTCYLGKTGFAAHSRGFFRELSKHVDLRVRNYTWDDEPEYLNEVDESIVDTITLSSKDGSHSDYPIAHAFPQHRWHHAHTEDFIPDVDVVLMEMNHSYFYDEYQAPVKIAYTVWESTEIEEDFFNQLLKFDYLWVVTDWHKKMIIEQGYPAYRVFVVHEGVDDTFCHDKIPSKLPELQDGRFKFLFFGRWDYRKAVPEILQTFLNTFDKKEGVDLILCADNLYSIDGMNSTEERLNHYGLADPRIKVKHFVNREDYISYIKGGHALVTCARSEGWNIPLIEAMASGTPALYSDWGAQREFAAGKGLPVKIAKELPANIGAELGFAGATPGLYAEPDFTDLGTQMRSAYDKYDEHKQKALVDKEAIRTDFSWEAAGLAGLHALLCVTDVDLPDAHKPEAAIILSHANTDEKEKLTRMSILSLKRQGYPVILSSHIPVPDSLLGIVDYFVYDKDNPVALEDEYRALSDEVPGFWVSYNEFSLTYSFDFNHGYAALKLIKNGLFIASGSNYKRFHVVNYDYIIKDPVVLLKHATKLDEFDVCSYKWDTEDTGLNCGFFSGKTDLILSVLDKFNSKQDYFSLPGSDLLEDFLYKVFTDSGISMYLDDIKDIEDKNCINSYIMSTGTSINQRSKKPSYFYLTKENTTGEYILCAIGSQEKPLRFVINYKKKQSEFIADSEVKPMTLISIPKTMVENGFFVDFPEHKQTRKYDASTKFANSALHSRTWVEPLGFEPEEQTINIEINFNSGPFVEITGSGNVKHRVEFIDTKTGKLEFTTEVGMNCWARCNQRYYKEWTINVIESLSGEVTTHKFDLTGQNVLVTLESKALGDTLSWFPHIEEFRQKHNCNVYVSTFKNELYTRNYPSLRFIDPGTGHLIKDLYATYQIGWFYNKNNVNYEMHSKDFRKFPMQATTTDILGLEYSAVRPLLTIPDKPRPIDEPYVCIAMHSTAQAKYWNNPTGWQEVTDYWLAKGRKVVMLSLEENGYMQNFYPVGVTTISGNRTLENTMLYLKHCEMFIGISSGLSWLAWAVDVPTVIISGFSLPSTEFIGDSIIRVFNSSGCNGCVNRHRLDANDWNWCPDHKGTPRQFECSRSITGKEVIDAIDKFYSDGRIAKKTVEASEFSKTPKVHNHVEVFDWGWMNNGDDNSEYHKQGMYNEIFEQRLYERFFEVEEGDIVLDVGSSVGPFTCSILHKKPKHIFCVEPSESEFTTLIKNTLGHPVTHINKGFSNFNGVIKHDQLFGGETHMESITFEKFIRIYGLNKIDFVKTDCEGGEYEMFKPENLDFIKKNVKKIVGEWHFSTPENKSKFRNFRDNILTQFNNIQVFSIDGVDIKWDLWNDHFIEYYQEVIIYIDNRT